MDWNTLIEMGEWYIKESFPMIYDEDREQENKANKENAKLLFTPKFIPFYPHLIKLGLWLAECLVYGFIDFNLQSPENRFYFTNEQIGNLFWLWEQYVSNCIKSLKDKNIIKCEYKIKNNGWKIRFIQLKQKLNPDYNNNYTPSITTVIDNNNIYIGDKKIFIDLVWIDYIKNNTEALKILFELFIKNWYLLEAKEKDIHDFVDWIKKKSQKTFWLKQTWWYLWDKTYDAIEDCFEYHKNTIDDINKKQSHKSRVNTWFGNISKWFTSKN